MEVNVDPGQHLALIHRVIHQMGLYGDMAEEAYSESLVTIVEASRTYNPEKGPLANWLANNIRWSIQGWISKQRKGYSLYSYSGHPDRNYTGFTTNSSKDFYAYDGEVEDSNSESFLGAEIDELVVRMKQILTDTEFHVLILTAAGYSGKEIGQKLSMSAVQITRTKQKARIKMEKYR